MTVLRGGKVSGEIDLTGIPERRPSLTYRLIGMMFGGGAPVPERSRA